MHSLAMSAGNSALVLKEFSINYDGPEYVHIVARKSGLLSWLLTMIGIDATTIFRVYADRIEFEKGGLSGKLNTTIPLSSVSIASCGYTKPFILMVLMILAILLEILPIVLSFMNPESIVSAILSLFFCLYS